jgi:hypothetical protein
MYAKADIVMVVNARTRPRVKGNRLVGAWYHDGDMAEPAERVATYAYDGLFRRIEKTVSNQGTGFVHHSNDAGTGILAGNRHEHYFYTGWRLIETTNHVESAGKYDYAASGVLNQYVWGTQYIDEPVRYDRNLQVGTNDTCIGTGGDDVDASYSYHQPLTQRQPQSGRGRLATPERSSGRRVKGQDGNWRVVALTGEDGQVVERVEYDAYGEPTVFGGTGGGPGLPPAGAEWGHALAVSTVGNPFLHQGLFRDRETLTYHNRFRQLREGGLLSSG